MDATKRRIVLEDLERLTYLSGKPVQIMVGGGHDTYTIIAHAGTWYRLPMDNDELLAECEKLA